MIKKTPAVTIVAACIKAETGVGPSMASGSHVCNKICADLPIDPINRKKHDIYKIFIVIKLLYSFTKVFIKKLETANTIE
jgi:hypothetical protein